MLSEVQNKMHPVLRQGFFYCFCREPCKVRLTNQNLEYKIRLPERLKLLDDEIIINGHYQHPIIFTAIHEELAVAMGIIKAKGNATPGPSTLVAFQGNNYKKPDTWARFFKLTGSEENFLEMRASVNWEIRGLNGGWFEKEFVNLTRTLHVYSNANTSTMVGNQVIDVLREVNFDSTKEGQQYFEPKHRQYLQVRQQEYEVMEIALDDLNGVPFKLGPGVTSVVLH